MSAQIVVLDGNCLTCDDVVSVASGSAIVDVAPAAWQQVERSRAIVDKLLQGDFPIYGLNTGFGSLRDIHIDPEKARILQHNLIRSHCCGVGEAAPEDVVRAMMLLRANTLAKGNSGVRPAVVKMLVDMLNLRVHPVIPLKGSVGASGDLAPLSHLALALIGEGEIMLPSGERVAASVALKKANLTPLQLEAKEGLALNNGTQFMTAVGTLAFMDAEYLTRVAIQACALSLEALQGVTAAYDNRIHAVRNQIGQGRVAGIISRLIEDSEILASAVNFGALNGAVDSLENAANVMETWNGDDPTASTDNATIREAVREIRGLVQRLASKRDSLNQCIDIEKRAMQNSDQAAGDELTRLAASRVFEEELNAVEKVFDRVFLLTSKRGLGEARKHLEIALDRLEIVVPQSRPVQDDYSLRCAPQVIGAALDSLLHVKGILERELNAATDNPLIFAPEMPLHMSIDEYQAALSLEDCKQAVLSGGNFHGQPIALAMDQACLAMATIGNIAERRIFHLTTGRLSNGLPRFLTRHAGLQSGMMIAQVTAASLVSENKTLCHPASADSIPTVEDAEDHVSMGAFAARKFAEVVRNVTWVVAIELICAAQGIEYRRPARPSSAIRDLLAQVRRYCKELHDDRPLGPDIEEVAQAIRSRELLV